MQRQPDSLFSPAGSSLDICKKKPPELPSTSTAARYAAITRQTIFTFSPKFKFQNQNQQQRQQQEEPGPVAR